MNIKDIPSGAVISVWGNSLFGRLIRLYSKWTTGNKDTCNHTAIYFGSGKHEIVEAGKKVMTSNLERYFDKRHKVAVSFYKELKVQQLEVLKAFCYGSLGKGYDYPGILSFLFKKVKDDPNKNFCSELIGEAYQRIGLPLGDAEQPSRLTPGDIYQYCLVHNYFWVNETIWVGEDWKK